MPYKDKTQQAQASRRHYEDNKDTVLIRTHANRDARKAKIYAYIAEVKDIPCADCGNGYPPYVMQFDHVRGTKKFNISHNAFWTSLRVVQEEIAKCDIVCANCHAERTHQRK
jgi:hypothetical protein